MDYQEFVQQRISQIRALHGHYNEIVIPRPVVKLAIERLHVAMSDMAKVQVVDMSKMDADTVRQCLCSDLKERGNVKFYWLDTGTGIGIDYDMLREYLWNLWHPGSDDVWIADADEECLIELSRNEVFTCWRKQPNDQPPIPTSKMKSRIMYVELKSDSNDRGAAWIGRVSFSKTGRTLYYRGRQFRSSKGKGAYSNYFDVETGEYYWISGCKKNGQDRHWAGGGPVKIDKDTREEYWTEIRKLPEHKDVAVIK